MNRTMVLIIVLMASLVCATGAYCEGLDGDFDSDGDVDSEDLSVFAANYGKVEDTCTENDQCGRASYCAKAPGDCEGEGRCTTKPQVCIEIYEPVCGCDNQTYSNACEAASVGVNVVSEGACSDTGFKLGETFPIRVDETKKNPDENIGIKFVEVVNDHRCPMEAKCIWQGNAEAVFTFHKADASRSFILNTGIEPKAATAFGYKIELVNLVPPASIRNPPTQDDFVASIVVTKDETSCYENTDCAQGLYCQKQVGDCDGTGKCYKNPIPGDTGCPDVWDPVCGCDGKTYSNICDAERAELNIVQMGECRDTQCDDGTKVLCKMLPPECNESEILAVQNNCWTCVNAATCKPWGQPGCDTEKDCPSGYECDHCGTSSCPQCADCVPACVPQ